MAIPLSRDISDVKNDWLIRDITMEEFRQTDKQIRPLKALAPDGIHAIFYQKMLECDW